MNIVSPITTLITGLINSLNSDNVMYAVLRDAELLPAAPAHDIDILVSRSDLATVRKSIVTIAQQHGWTLCHEIIKYEYSCLILQSQTAVPEYLPIDLASECHYRGLRYITTENIYGRRTRTAQGIWTVPRGFEAAMVAMKDVLSLRTIRPHVRPMIQSGATTDNSEFVECLKDVVGTKMAIALCDAAKQERWDDLANMRGDLIRRLIRRQWTRVLCYVTFLRITIKYYVTAPLGLFVVIVGPDGSGKTTVAEGMCVALKRRPFKRCEAGAMSFGLLPRLGSLLPWRRTLRMSSNLEAHSARPLSVVHSVVLALWTALDMAGGRILVRRKKGQGVFICHARYYYDYYFQPGHRRTPRWILRAIELLVVKPDLILFIDRPAEDIYRDKPELAVEEIAEQQQRIKALLRGCPNSVILDGNRGAEDTIQAAVSVVQARLAGESRLHAE